ncbi:MAG: tRNA (adenosine(37)-N6)-threonylcarbamoyltransferase complex dimerization subunit type 1 TsaB [Oscillochloridaceae bacterium umkhey_bin13]
MLVAIDTSTTLTGLALYNQHGPQAECSWDSGRNHTAQLLPQLDLLLRHAGVARSDLQAVAVALGPGSWSGLRVGLSLAKGLALAGGLTLLGIGTLDTLAYQHARPGLPTYPIIRLGRDRFATAIFRPGPHGPVRTQPDQNLSLAELAASMVGPALICGDLDPTVTATLHDALGGLVHLPGPAAALRRPSFLAELAWQRLMAGDYDDLTTLEPIYLGEPVKAP